MSVIELIKTLSSEQRERMVIAYVMRNNVTLKDFAHRSMDKGGAGFIKKQFPELQNSIRNRYDK